MIRIFLVSICLFVAQFSIGQRYSFVEFSTAEGLPQSQVSSITQDTDGYLWVGTLGGLAKFNGKKFTSYTKEDGLGSNKISFLTTTGKELWIGHEGSISRRLNGKFQHWSLPNSFKNIRVTSIIRTKDRVIISTNGEGIFELKNDQLVALSFPKRDENYKIRDLIFFNDAYYLATRDGLYSTKDFKKYTFYDTTWQWSIADLEVNGTYLSITTFNDGLFFLNPTTDHFTDQNISPETFPTGSFSDSEDNLWIYSNDGVLKMNPSKEIELINDQKGLPLARVQFIFQDREKKMWFGSSGKGLIYFPGDQFVHYNQSTGMPTDLVTNVNEDKKGLFWISSYNKGILLMTKDRKFETIYDQSPTTWTSAMDVDGMNWFGTEVGLVSFSGRKMIKKHTRPTGLLSDKTTALYRLNKSSMFVGGSGGLMLYDRGVFSIIHSNEFNDIGTIRDIEKVDKQIYLATDKGVYVVKNNTVILVDGFTKTTFCLAKDNVDQLWLGTEEGLYVLNNNQIENRNFANETASKFINFLSFSENKLYIGTNNGLYVSKLNERGKSSSISYFGIQEGVLNLETNLNSSFIDKKGNLWFGTASGLVNYRVNKKPKANYTPQLVLQNVKINYLPIALTKSNLTGGLTMSSSKNNLSFEFDGISLSNPNEVQFQFWLEGVEEQWSPPTTNPNATFTGLRSGDYVLHARAIGDQNNTSKVIKIPFVIKPPFYLSWWFITLLIVALALLVFQFFRFRIRSEREKNEKQTIIFKNKLMALEQQSLNASMNRHFIFNSLNSIQYFINTQDKISANKYLTNFAQLIRKNLDSSSSDGNLIPLSKEIERLKLYLSLESMRFNNRFDYHFNIQVEEIEHILIPAMLLQPFVENSIVHGILPNKKIKGVIKIEAKVDDSMLLIRITDNGIGISNSLLSKSSIEGDHRSQGMEITAKRIDLIKQMSQKGFEIIGPKDILGNDRSINGTYVLLKIPFDFLENQD